MTGHEPCTPDANCGGEASSAQAQVGADLHAHHSHYRLMDSASARAAHDPRAHLNPFTCGGNAVNDMLCPPPLDDAHFRQETRALNAHLWEILPAHMSQSQLRREYRQWQEVAEECKYANSGWSYDVTSLGEAVAFAEYSFLARTLHALSQVHRGLTREGFLLAHPLQIIGFRKSGLQIEALSVVVERADKDRAAADSFYGRGDALQAIKVYWFALVNMYPWVATPLIFTARDAFDCGVAQLQTTLWLRLAYAMRKRAMQLEDMYKDENKDMDKRGLTDAHHNWLFEAVICVGIVRDSRFITRGTLAKAYSLLATLNDTEQAAMAANNGVPEPETGSCKGGSRISEKNQAAETQEDMPACAQRRLSQLISKSDKDNPGHLWAHEHCIANHAGCGCGPEELLALL